MKEYMKNMYRTYMNVKAEPKKKTDYKLVFDTKERENTNGERRANPRDNK